VRLAVCVLLARYDRVTFARFKELTGETDGNLGANLRKLEDSGYVSVDKRIVERKPLSTYSLTAKGREALDAHVRAMREVLSEL
jgi:DNA-binding PadR family transcriptional regulator